MKYVCEKKFEVTYSELSSVFGLSIVGAFNRRQDALTEYLGSFGCDNVTLKSKFNAVWVVVRSKLKVNELPDWKAEVRAVSGIVKLTRLSFDLLTMFYSKSDDLLFAVRSEICAMDFSARGIRPLNSVGFPLDAEVEPCIEGMEFLPCKSGGAAPKYEYTVRSTDIDYSGHLNNTNYVKLMLNTLSPEIYSGRKGLTFDIRFAKETILGDTLSVNLSDEGDGQYFFSVTKDGLPAATARLCTKI